MSTLPRAGRFTSLFHANINSVIENCDAQQPIGNRMGIGMTPPVDKHSEGVIALLAMEDYSLVTYII
jgi:hypothetical protein